jgi:excisionase family DNA binding protein
MTPELRVLRALDELRDAMAAAFAQRHEPADPPALLTLKDAAIQLGVSRSTATRWADDGRLRTIGEPKARRVPRAEIERLAR